MLKSHFLVLSSKILIQFIWNIIFFPIWWYSLGFLRFVSRIISFWRSEQRALGLFVWTRNLFVPMYGQHDFAGRLMSFFVRLVQILFRGLAMLFWVIVGLVLILSWLALPLAIVIATAYQFLEM
ncbi:MAG: hypothetical protein PHE20_02810 [Patescibacteria group bacterium]|nr:hypothetical protein [Patescibacteria group bacterium]